MTQIPRQEDDVMFSGVPEVSFHNRTVGRTQKHLVWFGFTLHKVDQDSSAVPSAALPLLPEIRTAIRKQRKQA